MLNSNSRVPDSSARRRLLQLFILILIVVGLFSYSDPSTSVTIVKADTGCASSTPSGGAYTVTLCFTTPTGGSLTGNVTVTATASVTGNNPGVQRMVFYLDNAYLLTDYQPAYTFTLPTPHWVDGTHTIAVEALMRDGYTTVNRGSVTVIFVNGVSTPPVNTSTFTPALGSNPGGNPLVVVAAGDGAGGETNASSVVNLVSSLNPNLFLYLGDVYEKGSVAEFFNWYGTNNQNFSKFNPITDPTIGNHEYSGSSGGAGYFDYWNNVPNYYSYTTGGWHFISLNANSQLNGYSPASAQYQWLAQDLASNTTGCTLVYYHQPLYNIGPEGNQSAMQQIWALLVQDKVDIVVNGHDHDYQRWVPLDGSGNPNSTTGITEFVAGGGGHGIQTISRTDSRVAKTFDSHTNPAPYGALRLVLTGTNATYSYINTSNTVLDTGTIACKKAASLPTATPTATPTPTSFFSPTPTNTPTATSTPTNTPTPSSTPTATNTPTNTATPANTFTSTPTFTPTDTFTPTATFTSTMSPTPSNTPTITPTPTATDTPTPSNTPTDTPTPTATPSTFTFTPIADAYVNSGSPTMNYGTATALRADGSPDLHSYLKFTVTGLSGAPTQVILRLFATSTSTTGVTVTGVSDTSWGEKTIIYNNMPAIDGSVGGSSGPIKTANTFISINITSLITGSGTFSIAVTTTNSTAIGMASRETGANSPQLVITP